MDTVLGLAVRTTNVQTVLVEGRDAAGVTLEHDDFEVFAPDIPVARASEQVAEAVLSIAMADGHRLRTIGVTWSEDADLEAALVLDSLADAGFDNVIAIGVPHAAEALTRGISNVVGYRRTAVCFVDPESVMLSFIDTFTGWTETVSTRSVRSADALTEWVETVIAQGNWSPEAMFLVGSVAGLGGLAARLDEHLGIAVYDPPEAELALAHGAALASATRPVFFDSAEPYPLDASPRTRRRPLALPLSMLAGGAAAIVVSTSLLVSPLLLPDRQPVPTAARLATPLVAPPAAPRPEPPSAVVPEPEAGPQPTNDEPAAAPEVPDAQPPQGAQLVVQPREVPVTDAGDAQTAMPAPQIPADAAVPQSAYPVVAPQVPAQPRLRDRILDKIGSLNRFREGN
jgi:hypothetical protein